MGDAFMARDNFDVTLQLLDWIFENKYAVGLDGVDLSTVMPKIKDSHGWGYFQSLEKKLHEYVVNPIYKMDNTQYTNNYYSHKNIFRLLFYWFANTRKERRCYSKRNDTYRGC